MTDDTVTPAQTNPDAAPPPDATPPADAAPAPAAPAASGLNTALGGGEPTPAPDAAPPADDATPDYQSMVDALALPDGVADTLALRDDEKSLLKGIAEKATLSAEQLKAVHDELILARQADRQSLEQQVKEWNQQLMSDPELAGDDGKKWEATKANIERVFAVGDTTELRKFFNATGLGNHPLFVKHYAAIGALLSPDATRSVQDTAPAAPQRAADVLYADM